MNELSIPISFATFAVRKRGTFAILDQIAGAGAQHTLTNAGIEQFIIGCVAEGWADKVCSGQETLLSVPPPPDTWSIREINFRGKNKFHGFFLILPLRCLMNSLFWNINENQF